MASRKRLQQIHSSAMHFLVQLHICCVHWVLGNLPHLNNSNCMAMDAWTTKSLCLKECLSKDLTWEYISTSNKPCVVGHILLGNDTIDVLQYFVFIE